MSRRALDRPTPALAGPLATAPHAVSLPEACQLLGLSRRTADRLLAQGRFPIPALPSLGVRKYRFSSVLIETYLRQVHPLER